VIGMSWPRALGYLLVAVVLATAYLTTAPPPPPSPAEAPPDDGRGSAVDSVHLQVGDRTVRATRIGDQWRVVEPAGNRVPSDLIAALVAAVLETPAEPVSLTADRLADFGLDAPSAKLTFGRPNAPPVTLSLGSPNPAETGVYGSLEGHPQVVLIGSNVRYYIDLVLRQSDG
jgi:hypothetical protein